jgi:hypothetical protein
MSRADLDGSPAGSASRPSPGCPSAPAAWPDGRSQAGLASGAAKPSAAARRCAVVSWTASAPARWPAQAQPGTTGSATARAGARGRARASTRSRPSSGCGVGSRSTAHSSCRHAGSRETGTGRPAARRRAAASTSRTSDSGPRGGSPRAGRCAHRRGRCAGLSAPCVGAGAAARLHSGASGSSRRRTGPAAVVSARRPVHRCGRSAPPSYGHTSQRGPIAGSSFDDQGWVHDSEHAQCTRRSPTRLGQRDRTARRGRDRVVMSACRGELLRGSPDSLMPPWGGAADGAPWESREPPGPHAWHGWPGAAGGVWAAAVASAGRIECPPPCTRHPLPFGG